MVSSKKKNNNVKITLRVIYMDFYVIFIGIPYLSLIFKLKSFTNKINVYPINFW